MKKSKIILLPIAILLCLVITWIPSANANPQTLHEAAAWPDHISLSSCGSSQWVVSVGMAALIDKYTPASSTALGPTGGTTINLRNLMANKAELAWNTNPTMYAAWRGTGAFSKDGPQKWIRTISRGWASNFYIVARKDSGIRSFEDLKGKRWVDTLVGSAINKIILDGLLKLNGMSKKDYTSLSMGKFSEGVAMMKEKRTDAFSLFGGIPSPHLVELTNVMDIVFIPLTKEVQAKLPEVCPGITPGVIPAGSYKGQEKAVPDAQVLMTFITRKDIPEDVIYGICKAEWDHPKELERIHPNFKQFVLDPVSLLVKVPYHKGAIKYYKEKGLWTDKLEELQKKLLPK